MRYLNLRRMSLIIAPALFLTLVCGTATAQTRGRRMAFRLGNDLQFECEQLRVLEVSPGDACDRQIMTPFGSGWSQDSHLWFRPGRVGGFFSVELPINSDGSYAVFIYFTKAPDYGIVQVSLDGKPLGSPFDGYSENVTRSEQIDLGPAGLAAGAHRLTFQITGKNDRSVGYMAGADIVILRRTGNLEVQTTEPVAKKSTVETTETAEAQWTVSAGEKAKRPGPKPQFTLPTKPPVTEAARSQRLMRPLSERMTQLGALDARALVSNCSSRQNLLALSQQATLTPSEILLTVQEAEMAQVLGSSFTSESADLLRMMNIVRPEDFASFAGREEALEASAHRWATRFGMTPPSAATLQQWMRSAEGKRSELRAASELLPEATLKRAPYREVVLGDAVPDKATVEKARKSEVEEDYGLTEEQLNATIMALTQQYMAAGMDAMNAQASARSQVLGQLNIKAGEKKLTRHFDAPSPGLYLMQIQVGRPGGRATLKWYVEKPRSSYKLQMIQPSPSQPTIAPNVAVRVARRVGSPAYVSGYDSILDGAETLSAWDLSSGVSYYVYFWLDQEDLHPTFRPRIRLEVVENVTQKIVSGGIDTVKKDVPEDGPIVGSLSVQRYAVATQPQKQVELTFSDKPDYPNSRPPIHAVEMDYQPSAELHKDLTLPGLDLVLEGQTGQKADLQLLCNGVPVTPTSGSYIANGYRYRFTGAKTGHYTALVGRPDADPDLNVLRTNGQVYRMLTLLWNYPALVPVKLTFDGEGPNLPIAYVAELRKLQVGDQSEPDNDGNDTGDGEFVLRSTVTRLRTANFSKNWAQQQQDADKPKSWALIDAWPTWGGAVPIPSPNNTVYPHWAVTSWTDESLEKEYNRYSITFSLAEEDYPPQSIWNDIKKMWDVLMGLKEAFIAAWTFDYVKATQILVETAVKTVAAMQTQTITNYWDIIGFPGLVFDRDLADSFRKDDTWESYTSSSRAPGDTTKATTVPSPIGYETAATDDYSGNWAKADVQIRKVPTYWGGAEARLVNFALNQDIPDKQEIWVVWEPIVWYCFQGYCTDPYAEYEPLDNYYWAWLPHKFPVPPAGQVVDTPNCLFMPVNAEVGVGYNKEIAATYLEFRMYCVNPAEGFGEIFRFSRTFYTCDFVKYAAPDEASAKPLPPDLLGMDSNTEVRFFKRGSDYVGRFKIKDPGGYLSQVELEVTFHIFGA